ncbi:RTA1 domain-containing protein [Paraphaeosphaeria sporulosa]
MPELLPINGGTYYLWKYVPSVPASAIFAIAWLVIAALLSWRMHTTRTWFCSAFIIGCFIEFVGYCARAAAGNHTNAIVPYVVQSTMILLPPALFAATIYMCLGRIILVVEASHLSIISPRWLTGLFVTGDVLSFIFLGNSAPLTILSTDHPFLAIIGKWAVIGGLAIQLISFSCFGITAVIFHSRIRKRPTEASFQVDQAWIKTLHMLYAVSLLIIVRSIFRIIEYVSGENSYLLTHEWPLYVFDTVTMFAVAIVFFFLYPSDIVIRKMSHTPLQDFERDEGLVPKCT